MTICLPLENVVMNSLSLRVVSWTPKPQIDASSVTGESGRPSRTGLSANAVAGNNAATAASKRKANRMNLVCIAVTSNGWI